MTNILHFLSRGLPGWNTDGSVLVAISCALEKVRFGSRDDEGIALEANRVVRAKLDKHAISYADYKQWRIKNEFIFTSVVSDSNELIGFFDIFPLESDSGEGLVRGKLDEHSLNLLSIVPYARRKETKYLHIATIMINPKQKSFPGIVAKETVLLMMGEFIRSTYEPLESRIFTAFAQTKDGEALLKRSGFSLAILAENSSQHCPLYVLRSPRIEDAVERFSRAGECIRPRRRRPEITTLDERIESIELSLRELIERVLNGDISRCRLISCSV